MQFPQSESRGIIGKADGFPGNSQAAAQFPAKIKTVQGIKFPQPLHKADSMFIVKGAGKGQPDLRNGLRFPHLTNDPGEMVQDCFRVFFRPGGKVLYRRT